MSKERTVHLVAAIVLPVLLLAGCSGDEQAADRQPAADPKSSTDSFVGRVSETMDAGGYTYVHLERAGESVWAAGPRGKVEVGEELGVSLAMKMDDFRSETLNRTFDTVYFVSGFERGTSAPVANGSGAMGAASGAVGSAHTNAPSTDLDLSDVRKPEGGYTVMELWQAKDDLAGESVTFRGRVVKVNPEIMGRNWLHVQDGSGDTAAGTNDVTVTTRNLAGVGDLVLVRGTLAVDRDFGGGYRYGVIVENATVERE